MFFASTNKRKVSNWNHISLAENLEIYVSMDKGFKADLAAMAKLVSFVSQYI